MDDGTKKILLFIGGVIWAMRSSTKAYAPTLNVVQAGLGPTPPPYMPNPVLANSDGSMPDGQPGGPTPSPYMPTIQVEYTQEACERAYNTYNRVIPEVMAKYGSKEGYVEHCKRFGNS